MDGVFIPADAPHPLNAHRFIDFLLRPRVIAAITNHIRYANANLASLPFVDPEIRDEPSIYLPPADRERLHYTKIYGPKEERVRSRLWSRVKTGL